jgi:predicted nuclease with TOPRIM domain
MTEKVSNELIYEVLKKIQKSVANLEDDTTEIKSRLNNLENGFAGLRKDNAGLYEDSASQHSRYDRLLERIKQIEKRLEISE